MRSGFSPSTADATRWRTARTWPASSSPRSFRTIEARGGFPVAVEQPPLRDDEVDPRGLDAPDGADRPGHLALERAQVIDVLDEARRREGVALVEDLVADAAARRNALAGEVHADARELRARGQDRLAVAAGLVGDALRFEVADDGARVLEREVGVEHPHGGLRDPHDHEAEERHERERHRAHRGKPRRTKLRQEFQGCVHRPEPAPRGILGKNCPVHG